jgi:drug/metabolite transporter (DMT)-like permease
MIYPVILTVLSSAMYHFMLKQTSTKGSPMLVLFWSYLLAALACLFMVMIRSDKVEMLSVFKDKAWIPLILAATLVGIEFGYILSYKSGGKVGQVSMITQMVSLVVMFAIGYIVMKEPITFKKGFGIASALFSFHLLSR